jgi:hypothetical protein
MHQSTHEVLCNEMAFHNTVALLINIKDMFLLERAEFDFFNTRIPCGYVRANMRGAD